MGAGPGVAALALLWALALLLCLALARAPGPARLAAPLVPLGAALLSAALLLLPRDGERAEPPAHAQRFLPFLQIVDTFFIGRYVLLALLGLLFLGSLFLILVFHVAEPVYAKPLRPG